MLKLTDRLANCTHGTEKDLRMLDRVIGIVGIALAIVLGVWSLAPEGFPKMPMWITLVGMFAGVFLFGLAAGLLASGARKSNLADKFIFRDIPPDIVVSKKKFANERILLDGHSYRECTFDNVTFGFNGTRPFGFMRNTVNGTMRFASDNPAVSGAFTLLRGFGVLNHVEFHNESGSIIEPIGVANKN
jgi:hypothetical protein